MMDGPVQGAGSGAGSGGAEDGQRTAVAVGLLLFVLHGVLALTGRDPRMIMPHAVAWLHDVALLALLVLAARLISALNQGRLRRAAGGACRVLLVLAGALLASYPSMLQSFLAFPVNVLEADLSSASTFLNEYAGIGALWPGAAAVALGMIVAFMKSAPRTLVLPELVFGHSPAWRARTGKTPSAYYDEYLGDLQRRLSAAGLDRRTLMVIVSDHGERARATDAENYRVPLLVMGQGIRGGEDRELRSHLDLQAIMAHYLLGSALPGARARIDVVGSTERWIYGEIRSKGKHLFIDDSSGAARGSGGLGPAALHQRFQRYVISFAERYDR